MGSEMCIRDRRKVFDEAIAADRLRGMKHDGYWCDVGTLERLEALRAYLN